MKPHVDEVVLGVIGDIHGELYHLKKVLDHLAGVPIAGLLLVGDFGSSQYELSRWKKDSSRQILVKEVTRILELVEKLGVPVAWVPGNHDYKELDLPGNCDRRLVTIAGVRVYGIGGSGPGRFGFPYEWDEDEVRRLEMPECDVVLSHTPPARTPLDKLFHADRHVGSEAVREIAERHRGAMVSGHIHEAHGTIRLAGCLCMNVGSLGDPYGLMQVGYVIYSKSRRSCVAVEHENLLSKKKRVERLE
jgi:hypothetical protein